MSEVIRTDWANEPSIQDACLHVWNALVNASTHLDHYSFSDIRRIAEVDDDKVVAQAVMYLSNPNLRVLNTCLMYEYRGYFYELPKEEANHYAKGEEVFHPELGEPISTADILVFFTPGPGLQEKTPR